MPIEKWYPILEEKRRLASCYVPCMELRKQWPWSSWRLYWHGVLMVTPEGSPVISRYSLEKAMAEANILVEAEVAEIVGRKNTGGEKDHVVK